MPFDAGFASLVAVGLAAFWVGRRVQYAADDRAATVTGDPVALARALRRIERATEPPRGLLAPLYVRGEEDAWTELFSTHPPYADRIARIRADARDSVEGQRPASATLR